MSPIDLAADTAEIRRTLGVLFDAGSVVELRALSIPNGRWANVASGYFCDFDKMAKEAARFSDAGARGTYFTLNPVVPALLARSENKARPTGKDDPTTGDRDITRRRWLLLDFDPARPSGISSTDEEKTAALERARAVAKVLRDSGWPRQVVADSGNGTHLLSRIDLPADDGGLVQHVLEGIAFRFSDERVKIDTSVYNPARIDKLYGTATRKGDSTADRPHRLSKLMHVPNELEVVPEDRLRAVAAWRPRPDPKPNGGRLISDFDLERWIESRGLEVRGPHSWQGGRKWVLPTCPWNSDHNNGAAYIVQHPSGAIAAGCHHDGCQGRGWRELRLLFEPDAYTHHEEQLERTKSLPTAALAPSSPWARAVAAKDFLAAEQETVDWIAENLVAPGSVTVAASPRGLGKTHAAHALAVAVATGGRFRGRELRQGRVLLIDRDNSKREVRRRLTNWAAGVAENLHILTRDDAPSLTDWAAWAAFPFKDYDLVVLDSLSASAERVKDGEGGDWGAALAPLLDLARRGPGVLILANTRKDGAVLRGAGTIGDRADIVYEVRDATELALDPKKAAWWDCLPEAGDAAWSERSKRRRRRDDYRLAFVPSKFRIGEEPDPFALEIRLGDGGWALRDVTADIEAAHEDKRGEVAAERARKVEAAIESLKDTVQAAYNAGSPITKTRAEEILNEQGLARSLARDLLLKSIGVAVDTTIGNATGRGKPPTLIVPRRSSKECAAENTVIQETHGSSLPEGLFSAARMGQGRQKIEPSKPLGDKGSKEADLSPPNPNINRATSYAEITQSRLAARVAAASPWLVENRVDVYEAILEADNAVTALQPGVPGYEEALARFRDALEAANQAYSASRQGEHRA